jgi:transcriptional regulator with XRE-family HTH domain
VTDGQLTALAQWFERSGHTQRAIAERLGVTEAHLSRLISGERQPSLPLAVKISELTGVPASDLLSRVA